MHAFVQVIIILCIVLTLLNTLFWILQKKNNFAAVSKFPIQLEIFNTPNLCFKYASSICQGNCHNYFLSMLYSAHIKGPSSSYHDDSWRGHPNSACAPTYRTFIIQQPPIEIECQDIPRCRAQFSYQAFTVGIVSVYILENICGICVQFRGGFRRKKYIHCHFYYFCGSEI